MSAGELPPEAAAPIPPTPPTASESAYAVLHNRDFRLYLIARFVASLGAQMLIVAVGWELYERTHAARCSHD